MTSAQLYSFVNTIVLIPWLLMIFAPNWKWTKRVISSFAFPAFFAMIYLVLMILFFGQGEGDFSTLEGLNQLFSEPNLVLVGWLHYLAFDLVVGTWEYKDSQALQINCYVVASCLLMTLLVGPIGWLFYLIIRRGYTRTWLVM